MAAQVRVQFAGFDCTLDFQQYGNGRTGIVLLDAQDGEEVAVATVNVPEAPLGERQVLIKDYSENHGMLAALKKAGVVRATGRTIRSGFAEIPVCDLLVDPPWKQKVEGRTPSRPKSRDIEPER
jgi:hypothetical protein